MPSSSEPTPAAGPIQDDASERYVRKQVYLLQRQSEMLREAAHTRRCRQSEIVRIALDRYFASGE